jgi:hypothetical protein
MAGKSVVNAIICVVLWAVSPHYDFSCHLRMDRTVVVVRTWFYEGKRELIIRM